MGNFKFVRKMPIMGIPKKRSRSRHSIMVGEKRKLTE